MIPAPPNCIVGEQGYVIRRSGLIYGANAGIVAGLFELGAAQRCQVRVS
jgi:hypothetical protein